MKDGRPGRFGALTSARALGRAVGEEARDRVGISAYGFFDLDNPTLLMDPLVMWNSEVPRGETWRAFVRVLPHLQRELGPFSSYFAGGGGCFDLNARFGQEALERMRTYREFWVPTRVERQVVATVVVGGTPRVFVVFGRRREDPAFTEDDRAALDAIRRDATVWFEGCGEESAGLGALSLSLRALEQGLPIPAVLLDASGRLLWINQEGAQRFGVRSESFGSFVALSEGERDLATLAEVAREVAADGDGAAERASAAGLPGRRSGERLVVRRFSADGEPPAVLLSFVPEPAGAASQPTPADLAALGLSPRECDVALLAAEGASIAAIAERLAIAENTVQTHLKRLYRKLEVSSRAQLAWRLFSEAGTTGAAKPRRRRRRSSGR